MSHLPTDEAFASPLKEDARWMRAALKLASNAAERGEVPVGAIIVGPRGVLGQAANAIEQLGDPTAHAEMLAVRQAVEAAGDKRLAETTIYVTLEPCAMCAGAIVLARIPRVVFAAYDPKGGACGTLRNVVQDERLNHRCAVRGGLLESESASLLKAFFARLRREKK
jgi:tRNA(adenine34) deaminase